MVHAYDLALGRQKQEDRKFKASIGFVQSLRTAFDTEGRREEMKGGKEGKEGGREERKEGGKEGGREGRKEGGREGRKKGWRGGRKEERGKIHKINCTSLLKQSQN